MEAFIHVKPTNDRYHIVNKEEYRSYGEDVERKTLFLDLPDKEALNLATIAFLLNPEELSKPTTISFPVGVALVSDKDNYNKKIGRTVSKSKAKMVEFRISHLFLYKEHTNLYLYNREEKLGLLLTVKRQSNKVFANYSQSIIPFLTELEEKQLLAESNW